MPGPKCPVAGKIAWIRAWFWYHCALNLAGRHTDARPE